MIFPSSVNLAPLSFGLPSSAQVPTKRLAAVEDEDRKYIVRPIPTATTSPAIARMIILFVLRLAGGAPIAVAAVSIVADKTAGSLAARLRSESAAVAGYPSHLTRLPA